MAGALGLLVAIQVSAAQDKAGPGARAGGNAPGVPVEVGAVKEVTEAPTAEYTGLIEPATKALISAEVAGRVDRLDKKQGDTVRKGEVVAMMDNMALQNELEVLQARVEETEAQVRVAQAKQDRTDALFKKNLISAQQYEDGQLSLAVMRAKLKADRVQLERLQDQVAHLVIRSPIDGQVISSNLELGQWITPNQPIFEVFSYAEYDLLVGVPGRLLAKVPGSGTVEVTVPDLEVRLQGRIEATVRHVDRATGNFFVRVHVVNKQGLPLSGMLGKVRVPLGKPRSLLTVPRDAVVRRGERMHVVVVDDASKARIVPVQVQGNYGDDVIVSATGQALEAGLRVVIRGNERLAPGTPLRIAGSR